jgi:O-acetyl-ADP-ribose deacetylase (regulator of RNase III)
MIEALKRWIRRRRMATLKPCGEVPPDTLRVSLGDLNARVADRLHYHFQDVPSVEVVHGNLFDLDADAIVSPANSFGDMGGGIDKAIDDFHRGEAQRRVQEAIAEQFLGELPVGAALIVELPARRFPFVVAAPTMRIPGSVAGSVNAYLSMRSALVAVVRHNAKGNRLIRSLAVPGLGTGVGAMDPGEAAEQMRAAYDSIVGGKWREVVNAVQAPFALQASGRAARWKAARGTT